MNETVGPFRRRIPVVVSLLLIGTTYMLCREPSVATAETDEAVAQFKFKESALPEVEGHPPYKYIRKVHPNVKHIAAYLSTLGAAVALGDLDGDGFPNDVVHVDPRTDQVICGAVPGTPTRYKTFALDAGAGLLNSTMCPQGALVTDLNEDGLMDVLVFYWGRTPIAFLRKKPTDPRAPLSASDFVAQPIISGDERWYSSTATTVDIDGDGHLDLVIGNYVPDGSRMFDENATGFETLHNSLAKSGNGGGPRFLRWMGGTSGDKPTVRYEEQKEVMDDALTHGWTLAVGAADLDGDHRPEVYLANDFGPDRLLHNRSTPGRFQFAALVGERKLGMPASFVMNKDSFKGMGVDFGDMNGDGLLDIYVSNLTSRFALMESHYLWESNGETHRMKDGISPYVQASEKYGLSRSGWSWDCRLVDFNNDGVLEAIQANGFLKGNVNRWPELQSLGTSNAQLLHNPRFWPRLQAGDDASGHDPFAFFVKSKTGRYFDIAAQLGMGEPRVNRGIAVGDVDGDGRIDFAVANQWGPSFFYHNQSDKPAQFIGLNLLLPTESEPGASVVKPGLGHVSDKPSRPAVGASVTVRLPDGRKLVGQVDGGSGFSGKRAPQVHLGLGQHSGDVAVDVRWRDLTGQTHEQSFALKPGWHTIWLGKSATGGFQ